jgi:hypothetical protein
MLMSNKVLIKINNIHTGHTITANHQTNDKTRVTAVAIAAPKTRVSKVVIAPDVVVGADGLAVVDKSTELEVATSEVVTTGNAVRVLGTTATVLEFDAMVAVKEIEEAKDGGATALEGSTSLPFPQEIILPSSSLEDSVGSVIGLLGEAIRNRPVHVGLGARGAMN